MPRTTAKPIQLTINQKRILEQFANGTHSPQHLQMRSRIILLAENGLKNEEIVAQLMVSNHLVIRWRNRYYNNYEILSKTEQEKPLKLKDEIIKTLTDEQRTGAPSKFTDVQVASIMALSLEDPQIFGFPFSNWTIESLRMASTERKIVESISASQVRRFLKRKRY